MGSVRVSRCAFCYKNTSEFERTEKSSLKENQKQIYELAGNQRQVTYGLCSSRSLRVLGLVPLRGLLLFHIDCASPLLPARTHLRSSSVLLAPVAFPLACVRPSGRLYVRVASPDKRGTFTLIVRASSTRDARVFAPACPVLQTGYPH